MSYRVPTVHTSLTKGHGLALSGRLLKAGIGMVCPTLPVYRIGGSLRHAAAALFHQRHLGRVLRSP